MLSWQTEGQFSRECVAGRQRPVVHTRPLPRCPGRVLQDEVDVIGTACRLQMRMSPACCSVWQAGIYRMADRE